MAELNYDLAIDIYSTIKSDLIKDLNKTNNVSIDTAQKALIFCCELRQYCFYKCLLDDPDTFFQHKDYYMTEMQLDCNLIINENIFHHPLNNQISVKLRLNIIQLLCLSHLSQNDLQLMRNDFCNIFDNLEKDKHVSEQALAILGLALISVYENDFSMAYQGLNCAMKLYKPLKKLTDFIHSQLSSLTNKYENNPCFLTNPFINFIITREKSSLKKDCCP